MVESRPSKPLVAGSSPVSRSGGGRQGDSPLVLQAHVAQSVEHILGKDEVTGSNPVVGSFFMGKKVSLGEVNSNYFGGLLNG